MPKLPDFPKGVSQEMVEIPEAEIQRILKREEANKKRSETRRKNRELKEATRLAQPPATHEDAYWRHWENCPYPKYSSESKQWIKNNPWFDFDGKKWKRHASAMRSNSGKSVQGYNVTFVSEDGEQVQGKKPTLNRRNDPARNYGLPE
jgi:hypothetical protein